MTKPEEQSADSIDAAEQYAESYIGAIVSNKLLVGGTRQDIINSQLEPILVQASSHVARYKKALEKSQIILKELRVRVGTLLKADNASTLQPR
jgi:hypothetical protein